MFRLSEEITIAASPLQIFTLYKDVTNWRQWDPDVQYSELEGQFAVGTYGRLKPRKGPAAEIKIVAIEENRSFTIQSSLPLCVLTFEHELKVCNEGTHVVHRVYFDGPLSFLFSGVLGRQFRKAIPESLRGLKRQAEELSMESAVT